MTIRVMSSGKGYEYLLKSVVVGDGDREMSSPLTRYYTESGCPPGTWVGTGLMSLDDGRSSALAEGDTVTEEHLARLLGDGIHPVTGEKLGKRFPSLQPPRERIAARIARLDADLRGEARTEAVDRIREEEVAKKPRTAVAGFDLTFSPPKSVSAIWGLADAGTQTLIAQAHHAAMRDTIAMLEDRVTATRVGAGGIAQMPIMGVIATAFDHYDSRAADPQLHTHVVVSNKVQGEDGRWRTLDSRRLHKAAVALSESYNAFVTDHTARLLGVTWVPVDRGKDRNTGWEIEGVPAELIAEFSRRTTGGVDGREGIEQVKNRLIEQYVAEHGRQPSAATIAKLRQQATLETRPEKELHSLSELTADWRARAEVVLGEDATTWAQHLLDRGATKARLRADDLGLEQIEDLASVVLMEVANRRATWGRWNLHAETMRQIMGVRFATTDDRIRVLDQIVAHAEAESLRLTPDYDRAVPAHYIEGEGNRFQLVDQIAYSSQDILDAEQRLLAHSQRTGGPALTARLVARHTSRKIRGVRLDPDQTIAITRIARSGLTLDLLVGPAGSGKTTALRALHRAWTAAHGRDSVIGLAPSAAAAEVLGDSLGVRAENTAKFLYEHHHGRWNLEAGQLVLVDESSLAGTLALDRITEHAAEVGAKVVLIGDWAQLSAVETGGAFGMLVRHRDQVPELTDVRRFANDWEKTASLSLRHGNTDALDDYQARGRLLDGDAETMLDSIYEAWRTDRDEGLRTLMIAGTGEMVAQLNERARADLIEAGQVEADGLRLHDGTTAGVGDLVVTRLNDRRLSAGRAWVKNGDRWQVTRRYGDGSLAVRRLGRGDQPHGKALVLPARYVRQELELGYASTVHRAQGASVDTAHALVDPEASSRESFYVAMTRGKLRNHAYVIVPDPHEVEPHLDQPELLTLTDRLAKVLARTDADLSVTETLTLEVDRHASLSTLLDEYDVLAREAQTDRWATLLDGAPFPENVADDVFTSPYYEHLESALARHEAAGHLAAVALTALAPRITPGEDQADPAAQLADMLDQATQKLRPGKRTRVRVAGLIPTPAEPIAYDMQTALTERQRLIEAAAGRLVDEAQSVGASWASRLGKPPTQPRARTQWQAHAVTIALYRYRYEVTGSSPLGEAQSVRTPEQAAEHRTARSAFAQLRQLSTRTDSFQRPSIDRVRRL
ncbi:MobF family relaxase [uncultured Schumannella sp.]|uniref:MobF family relaxase n=1 Tax=uncultured Schumannella sp. TaxID=1195956 RepID=UPI0025D48AA7|nr:MobF family relaxase [uncultured Schumannella sp.]